jgi:hypothetical protein
MGVFLADCPVVGGIVMPVAWDGGNPGPAMGRVIKGSFHSAERYERIKLFSIITSGAMKGSFNKAH